MLRANADGSKDRKWRSASQNALSSPKPTCDPSPPLHGRAQHFQLETLNIRLMLYLGKRLLYVYGCCSPCVYFTLMELNASSHGLITTASGRLVPLPGAPARTPCILSRFTPQFPTGCPPAPGAVDGWHPRERAFCAENALTPPSRSPSAESQGPQPLLCRSWLTHMAGLMGGLTGSECLHF